MKPVRRACVVVLVVLAVIAEATLAGAGSSGGRGNTREPPQIIEEATVESLVTHGADVDVSAAASDPSAFSFRGRGEIDLALGAGNLQGDLSSNGTTVRFVYVVGGPGFVLIDGTELAERNEELRNAVAGRPWLKMPLDTFTASNNPAYAAVTAPVLLPKLMLQLLRGAEDQRRVGKRQFRLTIDSEFAFSRVPAADYRAMEEVLAFLGVGSERMPARVRVDADGRIKRVEATISLRGTPGVRVRIAYSGYGRSVTPTVVPGTAISDVPTTPFPLVP